MTGVDAQAAGLAFGVTAAVTMGVLWAARHWRLVDVPNERSAHSSPTPTLGGVGISVGLAAGLLAAPVPGAWIRALLVPLAIPLVSVGDDLVRPLSVVHKLLEIVTGLKSQGVSILLVEQKVPAVLEVADRVLFLENGEIRHESTPQDLERDPEPLYRYVGVGR